MRYVTKPAQRSILSCLSIFVSSQRDHRTNIVNLNFRGFLYINARRMRAKKIGFLDPVLGKNTQYLLLAPTGGVPRAAQLI